jgi:DNA modification methylase
METVEKPKIIAIAVDCLEWLKSQQDASVDLIIGSPPYHGKTFRYIGSRQKMTIDEWTDWMTSIVIEGVRVSRGYFIIIANGCVQAGAYQPSCEMLAVNCYRKGITLDRPVIWHKNATPNRKDWFGNDWEFCLAFKSQAKNPVWNWDAIATQPKYTAGGRFRQRGTNGERRLGNEYPKNKLARPRDVLRVTVGGGHLGWDGAHENEAPFPEKLIEPFILTLTNPGGTVLDPWCGSGTTLAVAMKTGRNAIGIDVRQSQVELTNRRLAEIQSASNASG